MIPLHRGPLRGYRNATFVRHLAFSSFLSSPRHAPSAVRISRLINRPACPTVRSVLFIRCLCQRLARTTLSALVRNNETPPTQRAPPCKNIGIKIAIKFHSRYGDKNKNGVEIPLGFLSRNESPVSGAIFHTQSSANRFGNSRDIKFHILSSL